MWNKEVIKQDLKKTMSTYRYQHSLRTMEIALSLAEKYHCDKTKIAVVALVHDIAKEFSDEENKQIIIKYQLPKELLASENKKFLHAHIGACFAKEKYHLDEEMTQAIKYHPTGREGMTTFEKIIYLADKIEPGKKYPLIKVERKLAYQNLDQAVVFCLETKINKLKSENKPVYQETLQTLQSLKSLN